jgi:Domain of unknown function (DUF222)
MLEAATGAFGAGSASVQAAILECMFEDFPHPGSDPEVIARFDELFERRHPSKTPESAELVDRICAATRAENRAAAAQLAAIGQLFGYRLSRCSENEDWAIDTMEAVAAEVAAALGSARGWPPADCAMRGPCASAYPRWPTSFTQAISTIGCFRRWCIAPI